MKIKLSQNLKHLKSYLLAQSRRWFLRKKDPLEILKSHVEGHTLYNAGLPAFPRNFSRDSFVTGILMNDADILREQILFSTKLQGKKKDPKTGEESGKIHHEYPGMGEELLTLYNACDTTALYLIAMETYLALTNDRDFIEKHTKNIEQAVAYIQSHIKKDLFWEDPALCGAERFALKVTYWKDSQLPSRQEAPSYPIVYMLAHFQNARGIKSASKLLGRSDLALQEEKMIEAGIRELWGEGNFLVAKDSQGAMSAVSSDALHVFAFLDPQNKKLQELARKVEKATKTLETHCGYRSVPMDLLTTMKDQYHGGENVWVFEQALIHFGARKFNLQHVQQVSAKVRPYLDSAPEIIGVDSKGEVAKRGCDPQLWTIAAKQYFDTNDRPVSL